MLWILPDTLNSIPKLCHCKLPHKSGPSYLYKNPPKVYGDDTHEEDPIVTERDKMTEPWNVRSRHHNHLVGNSFHIIVAHSLVLGAGYV